jgi:hypothetical protein
MAGFSIDAALKSGFRLARREPLTVFVWGVGYTLLGLLIQAIAIGPVLPQYLQLVAEGSEAAAALAEEAAARNALYTLPVMVVVGVAMAAVFYGGVVRALLHPEEGGFFHLKVSAREMWLALTSLVLALGLMAVVAVGAFALGVIGSLGGGGAWSVLLVLPLFVGLFYLAARFSTAWIQAFDEKRLVVADAWRLTAGQGWRIVLTILALLLLMLIIGVVVMIPVAIVAGILIGVGSMAGGAAGGAVIAVVGLLGFIGLCGIYGLFLTVAIAPYVEIYRALKGVGLPGGETADVFA